MPGQKCPGAISVSVLPFSPGSSGNCFPQQGTEGPGIFGAVNSYYRSLEESGKPYLETDAGSAFAVRLARIILDSISCFPPQAGADKTLPVYFYESMVEAVKKTTLFEEIGRDEDLLLIYMKQIVVMLKGAGIISVKNRKITVSGEVTSDRSLYFLLINSFWNQVAWEDLFPSNDEAARALHADRTIMRDLLLRKKRRVLIHTLANEFFEMTGFAPENDLVSISFLDFYLFAWLRHFNVIKYIESSSSSYAVSIELTEMGSRILSSLNN